MKNFKEFVNENNITDKYKFTDTPSMDHKQGGRRGIIIHDFVKNNPR